MQSDPTAQQGLRMARYLSGISMFTRGIGILGVVGSLIGLLAAFSQGRDTDKLGFSLIALSVLLIAVVVWSTGTFHGTVARLTPLLVQMDEKLEELRSAAVAERKRLAAQASPAPAPAAPAPQAATSPGVLPVAPPVESPSSEAHPDTEPTPAAAQPQASPPEPEPTPEPKPEPARTPCPSCGGLVHPEATRCVHCMKRIARS